LSYLTKVIPTTEQKYLFLFEQYFGDSIAPLMAKRYPFDKFKEGGIPIGKYITLINNKSKLLLKLLEIMMSFALIDTLQEF